VPSAAASPVNHRSAPISGSSDRAVNDTVSSCASMKLSRVCTRRSCISRRQRLMRWLSPQLWLTWAGKGASVILLLVLPTMPPAGATHSGLSA
jgi:hypothetical protein